MKGKQRQKLVFFGIATTVQCSNNPAIQQYRKSTLNDTSTNMNDSTEAEGSAVDYRWPTDIESRRQRVEAVLFMARKPLNTRKISQLADLEDGTQARTLIKDLNQAYNQRQRAFHIKQVAGGYQMRTRPQFADWIRRMDHIPTPKRLSPPALETLTVVAYRQPIIKADIEAIRGVSCGEMLRQLLEKGLIKIAGRSENLGRPYLYATSRDFLTQYGLGSLTDLPRSTQLSGKGLPQWATSDENHEPEVDEELEEETDTDLESSDSDSEPELNSNTENTSPSLSQPENHPIDLFQDGSTQEEEE